MTGQLEQARYGWQRTIDENPEVVVLYRKAQIGDGFGGSVENPFGAETPVTARIRMSHEGKAGQSAGPGGLEEQFNRYIMVNYQTFIMRNDVFEAIGKRWRVETVDPFIQFGGVVGYRASVIEATDIGVTT